MNFNFIYLHGFASGPETTKGLFFKKTFQNNFSCSFHIPNLNVPNFTDMSVKSQLSLLNTLIDPNKENIILGSSLGAYLAILFSELNPNSDHKLILMAPAINMGSRSKSIFIENEKLQLITIYHHYYKTNISLSINYLNELIELEKKIYNFKNKSMVFHGIHDKTVPIELTRKFLSSKKNCKIYEVVSDHQMLDMMDFIYSKVIQFVLSK